MIIPAECRISNEVELAQTEARCIAMEAALFFYADRRNWHPHLMQKSTCLQDDGELARQVLFGIGSVD